MAQGRRSRYEAPHGFGSMSLNVWTPAREVKPAGGIPDTHAGNSKLLSCICHHCNCGILLLEQGMVAVCAGQ